ncbi:alpha/beta hydrolase [Rhizobium lusitanum]|uniref:alpha/beta hydrolase n=1 Tax=Rhizobium lusitanum TaxID=293958 RepID=UPI001573EEFB|nr:alpha/beta hydrolase [Rhizobium lusitanum]NTJ11538.1 alpha/beta hydrolase [Rhizobium lusitanum]
MALSLIFSHPLAEAGEVDLHSRLDNAAKELSPDRLNGTRGALLSPDSTIGDILDQPAFAGFARQILPWDDRAYDANMRLKDIASILPYHSDVEPATVVSGLNRMIVDVNDGRTVFYDIYTEAQKRAQPEKANCGLFFFRGQPGAPFAVIAPGGGFAYVGSVHEGFPYAAEINQQGYNAFVLKYRAGQGGRIASEDLAAAISFIFRNAQTLGVSTADYSLWGSSAGARMAAFIGSHGVAAFGGDDLPRPSTVVMAYTAHTDTASNEPPTFMVVGKQDRIAPAMIMERRAAVLRRAGTPVEFHSYEGLGHGFGTGSGTNAAGWVTDAVRFWERFMKRRIVQ